MPGPKPKPAHMRQRRNKSSTKTTLEAPTGKVKVPALPKRMDGAWHSRVISWWSDVWKSPMASEYLEVHRHGLEAIAELWQQFHVAPSCTSRLAIHAEIRLAQREYGLTPMDLRRLQWEIKRAEKPEPEKKQPKSRKKAQDPRKLLRIAT